MEKRERKNLSTVVSKYVICERTCDRTRRRIRSPFLTISLPMARKATTRCAGKDSATTIRTTWQASSMGSWLMTTCLGRLGSHNTSSQLTVSHMTLPIRSTLGKISQGPRIIPIKRSKVMLFKGVYNRSYRRMRGWRSTWSRSSKRCKRARLLQLLKGVEACFSKITVP